MFYFSKSIKKQQLNILKVLKDIFYSAKWHISEFFLINYSYLCINCHFLVAAGKGEAYFILYIVQMACEFP